MHLVVYNNTPELIIIINSTGNTLLLFLTGKSRIRHFVIKTILFNKNVDRGKRVDIIVEECFLTHKRKTQVAEATE